MKLKINHSYIMRSYNS